MQRGASSGEEIILFDVRGSAALPLDPAFSATVRPTDGPLPLADLKEPLAAEIRKEFAPAVIVSETDTRLGGLPAINIVFTHPRKGSTIRDSQTIVLKNRLIYIFTAVSPDKVHAKYDPAFARILASVHWKP